MERRAAAPKYVYIIVENMYLIAITICSAVIPACAVNKEELRVWHTKITDPKFKCPPSNKSENNSFQGPPLLKIVDCNEPSAIYRYNYKVHTFSFQIFQLFKKCKQFFSPP